MSPLTIEDQIIDYLNDEMSSSERTEFELLMQNDEKLRSSVSQYSQILKEVDVSPQSAPSAALQKNFDRFINSYAAGLNEGPQISQSPKTFNLMGRGFQQAAIFIIILGVGLLIGLNIKSGEIIDQYAHQQDIMMDLLKAKSTSHRVRAVNMSHQMQDKSDDIINVLLQTAKEDESPHVRLAALDALSPYKELTNVKRVIMHAASQDDDASVQIAAIQLLKQMDHQDAIQTFDHIIQDRNALNFVKDEAYSGKIHLVQNTY